MTIFSFSKPSYLCFFLFFFSQIKSPYVIHRLTLNLEPACKSSDDACHREICTLDVRTHERGAIDVPQDSIHCRTLQSQPSDGQVVENIEKQIINQSTSLDHEVQVSADHNDRPFVAVKATQSEYCPGCPYELNPSLPGLSAFGDQVLEAMDEAGFGDYKHKLISIVRVTRAVPPGSNYVQYQLLMEIGESNCLKTSLIKASECPLQSNLPVRSCLVTFEERHHGGNRRITKNNCTDLLNTDNEVNADPNSLFFESVPTGRDDDASTKTEFYDQIAQEAQEVFRSSSMEVSTKDSLEELPHAKVILDRSKESSSSSEEAPKFTEKTKEFDEFLKDFDVPIKIETTSPKNLGVPVTEELIKPERVEDKVSEEDVSSGEPTVEAVRSKRSVVSSKLLSSNKGLVRKLAVKAVELVDDRDEDNKRKHLIDVIEWHSDRKNHATVFYVTVEVAPTDCRENDEFTECLDEVIPGPTQICKLNVDVDEKEPLKSPKLLNYSCKTKQKSETKWKRQIVGGPKPADKNDPQFLEYAKLGLHQNYQLFEFESEPIVVEVKNVTSQVVSGTLFKITTDIGESTCSKGVKENCKLKSDGQVKECTIDVWSQPWIDKGHPKITVKCDQNKRKKRSLRGQNYSQKMLAQSRQFKEDKLFSQFMTAYNKNYPTEEEKEKRFKIFKENLDMIEELQRNEQGTGRYGVTQFSDLTKAEFKERYLGLKPSLRAENDIPLPKAKIPNIELPPEYDWRHYNVVTPVKNQGQCGSCWAFSVTGNVEGQYAIKHGKLLSLSEQELVDCDKLDQGCGGGLPDSAYKALEEIGGLETETDYPYEAENEQCHFNQDKVRVRVISGVNITSNETEMAQWLVQNGPMSIGINANAMQFYMGGVSHPFHFLCNPNDLDHGVLIVGYGIKCKFT